MPRLPLSRIAALTALVAGAGVAATTVAASPANAATTTYTITDLGSLGGGITSAAAINASGQVTGYSYLSKQGAVCITGAPQKHCSPYHAFLWTNGKMTDLGVLNGGGDFSQGNAINDSGQVVGMATDPSLDIVAAFWNGRRVTPLPGLFAANGINDSGQIVGGVSGVFLVSNGTPTFLPVPSSDDACSPVAINNSGQVIGECAHPGPFGPGGDAVVWNNGTPTVLPTLGGQQGAVPTAINNNGQVVGRSETGSGVEDGFLWTNGKLTDLGSAFSPAAINDSGVMVGGQFVDSDGILQNLNNLIPAGSGYQIQSATGINDNGQIVANATDTATGQTHALLLTSN